MKLLKNHAYINGFEDYNIISIGDNCFCPNAWGFFLPYYFDNSTGSYIINKDLPVSVHNDNDIIHCWLRTVVFEPELVKDNKELLNTANKLFVHSSCKLSRSLVAEKYKKSLNPYLSDAIVIPKPNYDEFNLRKNALFINDQAKLIALIQVDSEEAHNTIKDACEGALFKDLMTCNPDSSFNSTRRKYSVEDVLNSEFFYYGEVLYVPNSQSWAMEVLTHQIPADKVVFEDSVQESLSSKNNQLDFDSLCSIMDMLNSSDEDTVSAGLKSLSMMDWMHYPQSIKFILNNTNNKWNWVYNKACNSTSVKYMMNTITNARKRSWWPGNYDREIYEEDFELFKKLKCHYDHILPQDIMQSIRGIEFLTVNSEGLMTPRLKIRN